MTITPTPSRELQEVLELATRRLTRPAAWPEPRPAPGQDRRLWASEVAVARSQHDAAALQAGRLVRELVPVPEEPVGDMEYRAIPVDGGRIGALVYRPDPAAFGPGPYPAVMLLHGGAYWMGGGAAGYELNDQACRDYCTQAGAVVVNVDHRLPPEHPYPVPLEDTYTALGWLADRADELRVDRDRIVVHGISSGGNLAAAAVQLTADRGGPAVRGQILQMPSVNLSLDSSRFAGVCPELTEQARRIIELYAGDGDVTTDPVSPGLRADLAGLPAAVVTVGSFDPLSADGLAYVQRLRAAGVPVTVLEYPMTHTAGTPDDIRRSRSDLLPAFRDLVAETAAVPQ